VEKDAPQGAALLPQAVFGVSRRADPARRGIDLRPAIAFRRDRRRFRRAVQSSTATLALKGHGFSRAIQSLTENAGFSR
jgi:hypothetical protein